MQTKDLKPGMSLEALADTWDETTTAAGGYLSGFADGEGYLGNRTLVLAQKDGPVLERVKELLHRFGFSFTIQPGNNCTHLVLSGTHEILRFLGTFRPSRLLAKADAAWLGHATPRKFEITLVSIEPVGLHTLVDIQTTEHTYVAEGVFTHNSTYLVPWLSTEGRIHPDFNQVRQYGEDAEGATATGRLSSSGPNFQNVPKRSDDGKKVRSCVVAERGHVLLSVDYCLAPGTRILKADLTWVSIESLAVGDALVGVDEHSPKGKGKRRKSCRSIVERTTTQIRDCYKLTLEDGRTITASAEHRWLMSLSNSKPEWRETKKLKVGHYLRHYAYPWEVETGREAGYLAGFFDGEGYLTSEGYTVGYGQNVGPVNTGIKALLASRGFSFKSALRGKLEMTRLTGTESCLRFLGTIRPTRLLDKYVGKPDLGELPHKLTKVRIARIEHVGKQKVISLQTSSRTYIAEGLVSHNCQLEWVILGILSGCHKIVDAYVKGYDIHAYSTEKMGLLPSQRDTGKRVTYLWVYGGGAGKIAQILGVPREQGQRFIDGLVAAYPEVAEWRENEIKKCLAKGYTETWLGRRRYVPELAVARNEYEFKEAAKQAYNMPPQGTAADIIKIATASVDRFLKDEGLDNPKSLGLVACVHDETVQEIPEKSLTKRVVTGIMDRMIAAGDFLPYPLQVDAKFGVAWGKMTEWKEV